MPNTSLPERIVFLLNKSISSDISLCKRSFALPDNRQYADNQHIILLGIKFLLNIGGAFVRFHANSRKKHG